MNKRSLAGALVGAPLAVVAVLSACAEPPLRAGIDVPPETPHFTGLDASAIETSAPVALCKAYECPVPFATCADKSGLCTTNLSNDIDHCGSCDVKCPTEGAGLDAFFVCAEGRCKMLCRDNAADCDHLIDNGCEAALESDPANCGACGNACAPGQLCWKGSCGCPSGYTACNGECVNLSDNRNNCGACGYSCYTAPSNEVDWRGCGENIIPDGAAVACVNGKCQTACEGGRSDCNGDFCSNGCEKQTSVDPKNCGACGKECKDDQVCSNGECLCEPGTSRCSFSCVDLQSDPNNCGACGNVCPGTKEAKGSPVCDMGRCFYACAVGYANCDGRLENGCEVDLTTDARHCGSCDTQCDVAGGQPCIVGQCLTAPCDAGAPH